MSILKNLKTSLTLLKKDKTLLLLSSIPIFLGGVFYAFLGKWGYTQLDHYRESLFQEYFSVGGSGWQEALQWLIALVFGVLFFIAAGLTFVLVVSIFASPFNDAMSARVESLLGGGPLPDLSQTFGELLKALGGTVKNELKKIFFILFLTVLSVVLGLIPFVAPLAIFISWILLSIQFLDYSWSRHDWPYRKCVTDLRKHFFLYGFSGGGLMFILGVPVINLLALPLGVIYYTVSWYEKNSKLLTESA